MELSQDNTNITVPLLISSNRFGIYVEQRVEKHFQQSIRQRFLFGFGGRGFHRLLLSLRAKDLTE